MMKLLSFLLLAAFWMTACASSATPEIKTGTVSPDTAVTSPPVDAPTQVPEEAPYAPQPGDASLARGEVFIQEQGILIRESYPPQISLALSGDLPTPCHQLRVQVNAPDKENQIHVEAYSVFDPNMACTQVLKPFQAYIDLGTYPSGHYWVQVNGQLAGEFDA